MSLIVGIRCADGVVLAASQPGAGPVGNGSRPGRQRARPLRVISGQAVLGVSGQDGVAQEMGLALEGALIGPDRDDGTELAFRSKLRETLAAPIQRVAEIQRSLEGLSGLDTAATSHTRVSSLVALPFRRALRLYLLDSDCSLTELTDELSYVAVGSSGPVAEPFLGFLRRGLWGEAVPTIRQGEMAAYWALTYAEADVVATPEGVQLVVIKRASDGSIEIAERGEDGIVALRQAVREAEDAFSAVIRNGAGRLVASDRKPVRKRVPEVRLTLERPDARRGFAIP